MLENHWAGPSGAAAGEDLLAVRPGAADRPVHAERVLVRRLRVTDGLLRVRAELTPAPGTGHARCAGGATVPAGTPTERSPAART